jgi:MinD-like ATPase involved in chromosome partitioning or flagellar assembly
VLALTGGRAGVGTTTAALALTSELTESGKRTLLLTGGDWSQTVPGGREDGPRRWLQRLRDLDSHVDIVVMDVGNRASRVELTLCRQSQAIVMVTTGETIAVIETFAAIKRLAHRGHDSDGSAWADSFPPLYLLVNRASYATDAATIRYRLDRACRRLLGFAIADGEPWHCDLPAAPTKADGLAGFSQFSHFPAFPEMFAQS